MSAAEVSVCPVCALKADAPKQAPSDDPLALMLGWILVNVHLGKGVNMLHACCPEHLETAIQIIAETADRAGADPRKVASEMGFEIELEKKATLQ